jgi:dihydroorotase
MSRVTIIRPDDWHLHLRDGEQMRAVLPDTAKRFARAIVMPNLTPPVTTTDMALSYRADPLGAAQRPQFEPLMTLYLTEQTTGDEIRRAKQSGAVHAVKYYPAGATTHSDSGVTDLGSCDAALAALKNALPLLVHGEVTLPGVDIFDREKILSIAR